MQKTDYFLEDGMFAETEHYIMKECCAADKESYVALYKENSIFASATSGMNKKEFDDYVEFAWTSFAEEDAIRVSVFKKDTSEYIANIVLRNLNSDTPELGIDVLQNFQRQGIASEVIPKFASRIMELQKINYFLVRIYSDNVASTELFKKLGAVYIGNELSEVAAFLMKAKDLLGEKYDELLESHSEVEETANQNYIVHYKYIP